MFDTSVRIEALPFALLLLSLPLSSPAQPAPAVVDGQVQTPEGDGVSYANVQLVDTPRGTATDGDGYFRFSIRDRGSFVLRASSVGYETTEQTIQLVPGDTTTVEITLHSSSVQLDEAIVTGETYSTGPDEQTTLDPLEAITTPGASGDLFRAFQSFPGVSSPGDGAGLFVRGGDVTETKLLLDQATVHYPYRYESPAGGTFGAVPPFLVDGTEFSMGGFSAQYGNALSGVLAMESKDRPTQARQYLNLGLAAASLEFDQPLVEDELGVRVSGNRSFTGVLFRVNGERSDYTTVPQGVDGNANLTWDYSDTGQLKLFAFARHNRIGVKTTEGAYSGVFRSEETSQLYNLHWTTQTGAWTVESSASGSAHTTEKGFGALDLSPTHAGAKLRTDATRKGDQWTLRTGGTVERRRYRFEGTFPTQPDVVAPGGATRSVEEIVLATRSGGYAELVSSVLPYITTRVGVRADYQSRAGDPTVDPRVVLSSQFSSHTRLRAAWGVYHQFPELATYSEHLGRNSLEAQRAQHVVLGLRHERDSLLLRVEAYHKPYRNLVVRTGNSRFANEGTGFAQGIDLFGKYGSYLGTRFNGWASYSVLRSHRTQPRDLGREVQLEQGPAPYDLTHQVTVVGKVRAIDEIRVGGTYRYTTGQPFTPVVDSEPLDSGAFLPIEGPVGSKRLPDYHRLDLQISYFWPFNRQQNVVFYAALNNAFNRANVVDLTYSADYSERHERTTTFRRSVYFGLTLTL